LLDGEAGHRQHDEQQRHVDNDHGGQNSLVDLITIESGDEPDDRVHC
jgi:hypothetical protein